jgi:very-short-patch-repair endonuclease
VEAAKAAAARLAARQFGVLTREQARALGMSDSSIRHAVRCGTWISEEVNVFRIAAAPPSWEQRLMAACLRRPGRLWVSHRAAAAFWGLDGFGPGIVEVTTDVDVRRFRSNVVLHKVGVMPTHDVTMVRRIPVTTIHRTLMDLGAVASADDVEAAMECALRRRVTSVERLARRLEAEGGKGKRGTGALRTVLARRSDNSRPTESDLETRFLQLLRRHRLPLPARQQTIYDHSGIVARVDFIYPDHRLIVEVDSRRHHSSPADWERDLRRRNRVTSERYLVLHATHRRMRSDSKGLAAEIRKVMRKASLGNEQAKTAMDFPKKRPAS